LSNRSAAVDTDEGQHEQRERTNTHPSRPNLVANHTSSRPRRFGGSIVGPVTQVKEWWTSHISIEVPLDGDVRDHFGTGLLSSCA